jgi:predicted HicB family RNase H-like nuclease
VRGSRNIVTNNTAIKKKVEHYMNLHYTMTVKYRPDLTMTGGTPEEAVRELLAEKAEWFETCLDRNIPIPSPVESMNFSGKILLRTSPSLHESLYNIAELEGVSLNQYVITKLAQAVGKNEKSIAKSQ